jgi:pheromone shutdown protein TraB
MPRLQIPLIDERDRYLMSAIREAPGKTIVGVVGAGHIEGMLRYKDEPVDRDALSVIPRPRLLTRSLKWIIPTIILMAFYYGYRQHQGEGLLHLVYAWLVPNMIAAALFATLAGAKPLSILVASMASPITSLNPTIGAGMVAGLVEAWLRKPTVEDCEGIGDAVASVRGMYRNPFTRVMLVFVATNLGSSLGAWAGGIWVVKLL